MPENLKKVSAEVAEKEVNDWLDKKRIRQSKRDSEAIKGSIEDMVEAITNGDVTIDIEKMEISQTLLWPIVDENGTPVLSSLKFKPRLRTNELKDCLNQVDQKDSIGKMCAVAGALTGVSRTMIEKLDTEDIIIPNAIVSFFM